jgi:hypothetical protein
MPTPDEQPLPALLDTADAPILAAVLRELVATGDQIEPSGAEGEAS